MGAITGLEDISFRASSPILAHTAVKLVDERHVEQCDAAGEVVFGIAHIPVSESNLQGVNEVDSKKPTRVQRLGIAWVLVGSGGFSAGNPVKTDNDGTVIAQGGSGVILGIATSDGTEGSLATVQLTLDNS